MLVNTYVELGVWGNVPTCKIYLGRYGGKEGTAIKTSKNYVLNFSLEIYE